MSTAPDTVDDQLCDRFVIAIHSCFPQYLVRSRQAGAGILATVSPSDLISIQRHEKEPTQEQISELLCACDVFSPVWLLHGSSDRSRTDRILEYMRNNRMDPAGAALRLNTTREFFITLRDRMIVPSSAFVQRFRKTFGIPRHEWI